MSCYFLENEVSFAKFKTVKNVTLSVVIFSLRAPILNIGMCTLFYFKMFSKDIKQYIKYYTGISKIALRGRGISPGRGWMGNFTGRRFFISWYESDQERFWPFEPFPELKATICKYWTSIKIKISMTCVCKEYEVKIKMAQEQWLQLKINFLLGYNGVYWEGVFFMVGGWANFQLVRELRLIPHQ